MASDFLSIPIPETFKNCAESVRGVVSYQAIGICVAVVEIGTTVCGSAIGESVYQTLVLGRESDLNAMTGIGFLSSMLYVSLARSAGLYRLPALIQPAVYLGRIAGVCTMVMLVLTAVLFLLKFGNTVSRGGVLGFAALMLVLCCLTRLAASRVITGLLRRRLIAGRSVVLVGEADELASLTTPYLLWQFGFCDVGRVVVDSVEGTPGQRRLQIDEASHLARSRQAKEFILVVKGDNGELLTEIEDELRKTPLRVRLLPSSLLRSIIGRRGGMVEPSRHLIELQRAPMGLGEQAAKRAVDIVLAGFALVALLPIFVGVALAIRLDTPGPSIFRQRRNGFNENQFVIFKFRTMSVQEDGTRVTQAQKGDLRVTRIGRFLRRTSIDELPQFLNVLKGDMSIVGPRPHALAHDHQYKAIIGDYYKRHHVKPGITGWAQVNGLRGETPHTAEMERRVDFDVWYIKNWSLMLDIRIVVRTCLEVVKHDAY